MPQHIWFPPQRSDATGGVIVATCDSLNVKTNWGPYFLFALGEEKKKIPFSICGRQIICFGALFSSRVAEAPTRVEVPVASCAQRADA